MKITTYGPRSLRYDLTAQAVGMTRLGLPPMPTSGYRVEPA
jgi:hypothetical protein